VDIEAYAHWVEARRITPRVAQVDAEVFITLAGMIGELGEVAEHLKKRVRDGKEIYEEAVTKEMGDVLFYWCRLCNHLGLSPDAIIRANIRKLTGRAERGTERGSGDDR